MENRRKTPRFKLHQVIEVSYFKESFIHVTSVDISISGLHFEASERFENDARVFLMFEVPDGDGSYMIKCDGILMWQKEEAGKFQAGVLFTTLSDLDKEKLQKYLDSSAVL